MWKKVSRGEKKKWRMKDEQTICKLNAGTQYALEKGIGFVIWGNVEEYSKSRSLKK